VAPPHATRFSALAPVVTTAEIDRPTAQVFATATDRSLFPSGRKASKAGTWTRPTTAPCPLRAQKCVTTRRIGGSSRQITSELPHIDPPRTWGVRGTDDPIRATVDVVVEPVTESRSRLTISVD
jgi:hypothetical protein